MIRQAPNATMKLPRQLYNLSRASSARIVPCRRANTRFLHISSHPAFSASPIQPPRRPILSSTPRPSPRYASTSPESPTADALMENLTDLYSTAKDEFEIAAEETEKKTTYGAEDREAAHEAFHVLKEAYEKAIGESGEAVGKEVERRVGPRIRELESALRNMDEMALED